MTHKRMKNIVIFIIKRIVVFIEKMAHTESRYLLVNIIFNIFISYGFIVYIKQKVNAEKKYK